MKLPTKEERKRHNHRQKLKLKFDYYGNAEIEDGLYVSEEESFPPQEEIISSKPQQQVTSISDDDDRDSYNNYFDHQVDEHQITYENQIIDDSDCDSNYFNVDQKNEWQKKKKIKQR